MRCTVDLDTLNQFKFLRAYLYLKRLSKRMEVWLSSSGGGYHVVGYGLRLDQQGAIELRRLLGDDLNRIRFDEETLTKPLGRRKPMQVLYDKRGYGEAVKLDEGNILALPFFSRIPRSYIVGVNGWRRRLTGRFRS